MFLALHTCSPHLSSRAAGEAWADNVQKLRLEHEDEGPLGTMYLDLYPRHGITMSLIAAHTLALVM